MMIKRRGGSTPAETEGRYSADTAASHNNLTGSDGWQDWMWLSKARGYAYAKIEFTQTYVRLPV